LPWSADAFDAAVAAAVDLLPEGGRFSPDARLNGVFAVTADNLPLLGPAAGVRGLWFAEALWVTHAAGAARELARVMAGQEPTVAGLDLLRPDRFAGRSPADLRLHALAAYNDSYAADRPGRGGPRGDGDGPVTAPGRATG
jgi:glycine/D-amino acid oxidase-like deaminating enzyme